jgi:hypothetical protein
MTEGLPSDSNHVSWMFDLLVLLEIAPDPLDDRQEQQLSQPDPLRPLTSLKWPYVPEESAYPDPLKRDDPKPLQLRHYEAIGARCYESFI